MGKATPQTREDVRPLLLLGAGASAPFGIPTMEGFLKDSWKEIDEASMAGSIACRRSLELFEKIDLEEVMYVLEGILRTQARRSPRLAVPRQGEIQDSPSTGDSLAGPDQASG